MTSSSTALACFDGHNDTMLKLALDYRGSEKTFWQGFEGHLDGPRAQAGGLKGGICAIFVPNQRSSATALDALTLRHDGFEIRMARPITHEYARELTIKVMGVLQRLAKFDAHRFCLATDMVQLREAIAQERFAAVMHFEGAEAIDPDLALLPLYYESGLRSLGLVWSRPNAFGHGVPFKHPCSPDIGPGLSEAGVALVRACEQLGIMIDMAHLNLQGFWNVARLSTKPLVVSHACAHAICPSARNLLDTQLDAIAESGGLIGVNFFVGDVRPDGMINPDTPLDMLADHFVYIADRIGVAHVALGSDFDGATMSRQLNDAAALPKLFEALQKRGFSRDELALIAQENWLRVLGQTWRSPA